MIIETTKTKIGKAIEFHPLDSHLRPKYKVGTIFRDSLSQEYRYCGVKMGRGLPLVYRWVPIAWIATMPVVKVG
jgi:hypothetical protein